MKINELKIKVSKKLIKDIPELNNQIINADDIFKLSKYIFDSDSFLWREEFIVLCLNKSSNLIGFHKVSSGGTVSSIADLKVIFTLALKSLAQAIIVIHNHPSGCLNPSKADIEITKKIKEAGKIIDIELLDSIIVTEDKYYSFANERLI